MSGSQHATDVHVLIVGAGMSGIAMGVALRRAGIDDLLIVEKGDAVGGTWRENTYPGVACDVVARCYCFSFAPNPAWSTWLPGGAEIRAYFEGVARDHGLLERTRFGVEVTQARWAGDRWRVATRDGGTITARALVTACGILHHPVVPDIPGLDRFAGPAFHTARWNHDVDPTGRRVGIIGTGSTSAQITPALAGVAADVTVFQRTAQWILPLPNRRLRPASAALFRRFPRLNRLAHRGYSRFYDWTFAEATRRPGLQRRMFSALCRWNLRRVRDPELRRRLTPADDPMCRRLVMSWSYYDAIQRPDVTLVDRRIREVVPDGIVTEDGAHHPLDVLVLATGFDTRAYMRPIDVVGCDGTRLDDVWGDTPRAYRTVAVPRFPSFFVLLGPHSPVGNQSLVAIAEVQARWITEAIGLLDAADVGGVVPREDVTAAYNARMLAAMGDTAWTGGCDSWYLDGDGLPLAWPWTPREHGRMLATVDRSELELLPAGAASAAATATATAD